MQEKPSTSDACGLGDITASCAHPREELVAILRALDREVSHALVGNRRGGVLKPEMSPKMPTAPRVSGW